MPGLEHNKLNCDCHKQNCPICNEELLICKTCGCDFEMLSFCPGFTVSDDVVNALINGKIVNMNDHRNFFYKVVKG